MEDGTATPPAPAAAREARRRKILGSGTDRLAFITGQAKSVPHAPPSAATDREPPPEATVPEGKQLLQERSEGKVGLTPSQYVNLPKHHLIEEATRKATVADIGLELPPKGESSDTDGISAPKTHASPEMAIPSEGSSFQRYDGRGLSRHERTKNKIFTASRISKSISSSENIRLLCAAAVALLVVLSYHVGLFSTTFRPLYLVLITDVSLVIALLLASGKLPEKDDEARQQDGGEYDLAELFSLGLLVHKVTRALFVDCCLCIVLVIMGVAFGEKPVN